MARPEISENAMKALGVLKIGENGMVHWGPLDQYMTLFGVDEDTACEMLDDIQREMEQKGYWEDISGSMYDIEAVWNHAMGIH